MMMMMMTWMGRLMVMMMMRMMMMMLWMGREGELHGSGLLTFLAGAEHKAESFWIDCEED